MSDEGLTVKHIVGDATGYRVVLSYHDDQQDMSAELSIERLIDVFAGLLRDLPEDVRMKALMSLWETSGGGTGWLYEALTGLKIATDFRQAMAKGIALAGRPVDDTQEIASTFLRMADREVTGE